MNYRYLFPPIIACNLLVQVVQADSDDIFSTSNDDAITYQHEVECQCNDRCLREFGQWTGLWHKIDSTHSVCQCYKLPRFSTNNNDPIWHNNDAQEKCPARCENEWGLWTGGWWTTEFGQHSVCECAKTS